MFLNSLIGRSLFSLSGTSVICIAVEGSNWHRYQQPRCALSPLRSLWASSKHLMLPRWRMRPQISYLLMVFTRRGTQPWKKREASTDIPSRYISSSVLWRGGKKDSDYRHTVLKSYSYCSDCRAPALSRCVHFCLYFRGDGGCGCVRVEYCEQAELLFFIYLFFFFLNL